MNNIKQNNIQNAGGNADESNSDHALAYHLLASNTASTFEGTTVTLLHTEQDDSFDLDHRQRFERQVRSVANFKLLLPEQRARADTDAFPQEEILMSRQLSFQPKDHYLVTDVDDEESIQDSDGKIESMMHFSDGEA